MMEVQRVEGEHIMLVVKDVVGNICFGQGEDRLVHGPLDLLSVRI